MGSRVQHGNRLLGDETAHGAGLAQHNRAKDTFPSIYRLHIPASSKSVVDYAGERVWDCCCTFHAPGGGG
eukprot:1483481-Prymnesium_polylepis.1